MATAIDAITKGVVERINNKRLPIGNFVIIPNKEAILNEVNFTCIFKQKKNEKFGFMFSI